MDPYKWLAELGLFLLLCFSCAYAGYSYEKKEYNQFKLEVAALAKTQENDSKQKDKEVKQNAINAQTESTNAITSIHDYYQRNPVRMCGNTSSSSVSSPISGLKVITPSVTQDPVGEYSSPYSPEMTEEVGLQLQELMKQLIEDGVTTYGN